MTEQQRIDAMLAGGIKSEPISWPAISPPSTGAVWARIAFHGIPAALNERAICLRDWPKELRERLETEARLIGLWEETHKDCIGQAVDRLAAAHVENLVMKGTALAYTLYPDPAWRRRGDTDLLVLPTQLDRARNELQALGWVRRASPHGLLCQECWQFDTGAGLVHDLDLHWQPTDRPTLQTVLRIEEFFESSHPLPKLSSNARAPDPVLTMMQVCINQAWHGARGYGVEHGSVRGGNRLIWSMDLDLLARAFDQADWEKLVALSESRGTARLVFMALRTAQEHLGTPLPPIIEHRLSEAQQPTAIEQYINHADLAREFQSDLRMTRSAGAKFNLILANVLPPRRHLVQKYPSWSGWPTPLLTLRHVLDGALRLKKTKRPA